MRGDRIEYFIPAISEFTHRCVTTLERIGDEASDIKNHDEAVAVYSTALLLGPSAPNALLIVGEQGIDSWFLARRIEYCSQGIFSVMV